MKNKKLMRMLAGINQNYLTVVAQEEAIEEVLLGSARESAAVACAVNDFLQNVDWGIESGAYAPGGDYAQAADDLRDEIRSALKFVR